MVKISGKEHAIFNPFFAGITETLLQKYSICFRKNLEPIREVLTYKMNKKLGYENSHVTTPIATPKHTHIVAASTNINVLNYIPNNNTSNSTLWMGAIHQELTTQSYIMPELVNTGDVVHSTKI